MASVLETVLPVFLIIVLGYGAGRFGLFAAGAVRGLTTFVFAFAIPALLFRSMVNLGVPAEPPWALWGAFFGSIMVVWVLAILQSTKVQGLLGAGGAAAAMGAGFGNTVMLGLPLGVAHFGEAAVLPMALMMTIHLPLQWFVATLIAQGTDSQKNVGLAAMTGALLKDLLTNPIVLALLFGFIWNLTGLGMHSVADRVVNMLAQAAVPAALFALGLSLVKFGLRGEIKAACILMALKMVCLPAVAWLMAFHVFDLPLIQASVVVLFAALPTGANAYIFAERYGAAEAAISASVAIGTALSIVTLSVVFVLLTGS